MFNIDLKNIVEKDKDEVELECPKCGNDLLSYFHGTFLLTQVLSGAKRGKNAHKFKLIDGELYSYENNDWEIKEKQYPPEIFICKCGFYSESKYDFIVNKKITNNTPNKFNEELNNSNKTIEDQKNKINNLTNQLNLEKENNKKMTKSLKELNNKLIY